MSWEEPGVKTTGFNGSEGGTTLFMTGVALMSLLVMFVLNRIAQSNIRASIALQTFTEHHRTKRRETSSPKETWACHTSLWRNRCRACKSPSHQSDHLSKKRNQQCGCHGTSNNGVKRGARGSEGTECLSSLVITALGAQSYVLLHQHRDGSPPGRRAGS